MVEFAIKKDSVGNGVTEEEGGTYEITPGGGYHTYEPPVIKEEEEKNGAPEYFKMIEIDKLKVVSPYKDLFTINSDTVDAIAKDMKAYGYDTSVPIVVNDEYQVVDGHTRLQAAKQAGLSEVTICQTDFEDEEIAVEYAIHNQVDRRNMTNKGLLETFKKIDKRMPKYEIGQKFGKLLPTASSEISKLGTKLANGKSIQKTAKKLGIGISKAENIRTVLDHGDEETIKQVEDDKKSIHAAAKEIRQKGKNVKPTASSEISKLGTKLANENTQTLAEVNPDFQKMIRVRISGLFTLGENKEIDKELIRSAIIEIVSAF